VFVGDVYGALKIDTFNQLVERPRGYSVNLTEYREVKKLGLARPGFAAFSTQIRLKLLSNRSETRSKVLFRSAAATFCYFAAELGTHFRSLAIFWRSDSLNF